MAKIIDMREYTAGASGRKKNTRFIVRREFVGTQTMEDAFAGLIERRIQTEFEHWREEPERWRGDEHLLQKAG